MSIMDVLRRYSEVLVMIDGHSYSHNLTAKLMAQINFPRLEIIRI